MKCLASKNILNFLFSIIRNFLNFFRYHQLNSTISDGTLRRVSLTRV